MLFNSIIFLFLFLPVFISLYFIVPGKIKNGFIVFASLIFYIWAEPRFIFLLLLSIMLNYFFGILLDSESILTHRNKNQTLNKSYNQAPLSKRNLLILLLSVLINISILFLFKYLNFFISNYNALMNHIFTDNNSAQIAFRVGLPLGISFYTFKAISYSVDVYKKAIPSERKFIDFACYLIIFPEISAGPIDRYKDLQKNIKKKDISLDNFYYGIKRFIIGLAKKVIIANTLSITTDQIFSIPGNHLTFSLAWLGIICYTLQIYYDFSGYTDMAIGLGRVMGFKFAENFNYPYISISITEFWKRWHITLSNWFRDYVYFPIEGKHLGMNPKGEHVTYLNLMITFVLCGFWHGASWGFIFWGFFHGFFIIFERMTGIIFWRPNSNRVLKHSYFLFIISLSWVFFRANSVRYALSFVKTMFGFGEGNNEIFYPSMYINGELIAVIIVGILFSVPVLKYMQNLKIINNFKRNEKLMTSYNYTSGIIEIIVYVILILLCYSSVAVSTHNPFIYFRF